AGEERALLAGRLHAIPFDEHGALLEIPARFHVEDSRSGDEHLLRGLGGRGVESGERAEEDAGGEMLHFFSLTVSTGSGDRRTRRSAVEPRRSCSKAERPCVPMTTSEAFMSAARFTRASEGRPQITSHADLTPRFSAARHSFPRRSSAVFCHSVRVP